MTSDTFALILAVAAVCAPVGASELNETILTSTLLAPGIRTVADELTQRFIYPDTRLGIRSTVGAIVLENDDDSLYGDGFASGIQNVPVDGNSIRFAVTGYDDLDFLGEHTISGEYEVFVDVFDSASLLIDAFSEVRTLTSGSVDEFSFSDPDWIGGKYRVNIDNINGPNDVDFFTFRGLLPGATFTARTSQVDSANVDTFLGWFSAAGAIIKSDDDSGGGMFSLLQGIVPAGGNVTLAVTGFGDPSFDGSHNQSGKYQLRVSQDAVTMSGDYNGNGVVDAADYSIWRNTFGQSGSGLAADGDPNNQIDNGDYLIWKSHFGETSVGSGGIAPIGTFDAIPEPSTFIIVTSCAAIFLANLQRPRQSL